MVEFRQAANFGRLSEIARRCRANQPQSGLFSRHYYNIAAWKMIEENRQKTLRAARKVERLCRRRRDGEARRKTAGDLAIRALQWYYFERDNRKGGFAIMKQTKRMISLFCMFSCC